MDYPTLADINKETVQCLEQTTTTLRNHQRSGLSAPAATVPVAVAVAAVAVAAVAVAVAVAAVTVATVAMTTTLHAAMPLTLPPIIVLPSHLPYQQTLTLIPILTLLTNPIAAAAAAAAAETTTTAIQHPAAVATTAAAAVTTITAAAAAAVVVTITTTTVDSYDIQTMMTMKKLQYQTFVFHPSMSTG